MYSKPKRAVFLTILHRLMVSGSDRAFEHWRNDYPKSGVPRGEGKKELVGFTDGTRESAHDWRGLLLDLKRRGLDVRPGSHHDPLTSRK
jgi:hypothetical protein